ncbi:MAG TPA: arginine deiminase family protein [Puia sp.]
MSYTCQSETGKIKTVYIKRAADAFLDEETMRQQWEALNFLDKPVLGNAMAEYEVFESLLAAGGTEIHTFPQDPRVSMDSIYCRDAAIATDHGIILCNMGKPARADEPAAQGKIFKAAGLTILGSIKAPGTVEGGDVAWLDEHTLAVGHTYRTNQEGIRQLTALVAPWGVTVIPVPLPHYKGPGDVFHLMSILSPVDKDLAVVYSPLMPIVFRNWLLDRGYALIEVPAAEWDSMGCNVLALAPRECLMVAGNPQTHAALEAAGCIVHTYVGAEISVKGGGGPTCLTRPLLRER